MRRAAATNFAQFASVLDTDAIKSDFLPILDNLLKESQVRRSYKLEDVNLVFKFITGFCKIDSC